MPKFARSVRLARQKSKRQPCPPSPCVAFLRKTRTLTLDFWCSYTACVPEGWQARILVPKTNADRPMWPRFETSLLSGLLAAMLALVGSASGYAAEPDVGQQATHSETARLGPAQLDRLILAETGSTASPPFSGELFLRRVYLDLLGRLPTTEEQQTFAVDADPASQFHCIERLLGDPGFGTAWADYWTDTIAFHVPPPELTYLNYAPLKRWFAQHLNANTPWDVVVRELLTAKGKVNEQPAASFVGYHQGVPTNLAAEASRIFLGQQIGCAECHDHPFDSWKRVQFHQLAAYFARAKVKLSQNDGGDSVVSALDKGEYLMPDIEDPRRKGTAMRPAVLTVTDATANAPVAEAQSLSDDQRRQQLAAWITARDNPWFAQALVNRIWARLMGRGFYEPVDDLGESRTQELPSVHAALTAHFIASGYDLKDLYRVILQSESYRHGRLGVANPSTMAGSGPRLRGDEVFAALQVALGLPNVTPPKVEPTAAIRFPPPPKSTQALVHEAFGTDPSLSAVDAPRTMGQALWMMNNTQLQQQINAAVGSGTMLARLLEAEADDSRVCQQLYARALARSATKEEVALALEHLAAVGDRRAAFEDLLWSLVNSAEFTTRR